MLGDDLVKRLLREVGYPIVYRARETTNLRKLVCDGCVSVSEKTPANLRRIFAREFGKVSRQKRLTLDPSSWAQLRRRFEGADALRARGALLEPDCQPRG